MYITHFTPGLCEHVAVEASQRADARAESPSTRFPEMPSFTIATFAAAGLAAGRFRQYAGPPAIRVRSGRGAIGNRIAEGHDGRAPATSDAGDPIPGLRVGRVRDLRRGGEIAGRLRDVGCVQSERMRGRGSRVAGANTLTARSVSLGTSRSTVSTHHLGSRRNRDGRCR